MSSLVLGLLVHSELTADMRTEQIGLLKGILTFFDGSTLFFKEYLDLRYSIDKKCIPFIIKTLMPCCASVMTMLLINHPLVSMSITIPSRVSFQQQVLPCRKFLAKS